MNPRPSAYFAILVVWVLGLLTVAPATAQDTESTDTTSRQLWASYQLFKPHGDNRWVLHFEGRSNSPDDEEKFKSLDGRVRFDIYPKPWIDLFPELLLRYTVENNDVNSFLTMLRGGIRFSVPSTEDLFHRERVPLYRFDFGLLVRAEWRHFNYSDGSKDSSWRIRPRFECRVPLNHASMGDNRTVYLRGDVEAFLPLGEESEETFANRLRFRLGLGYRHTYHWRLEVLGIWQESRNTLEDDFKTSEFMLSVALKHHI